MQNSHIFTIIKEEVKLDSKRPCYPDNYQEGLAFIKQAGASLRAVVDDPSTINKSGRVMSAAVSLLVQTTRFLRHLT